MSDLVDHGQSRHLLPYVDVLAAAPGANLRICVAVPPQHGKTRATVQSAVQWLERHPLLNFAYATYSFDRALRVVSRNTDIAHHSAVSLAGSNVGGCQTSHGGQMLWLGVGASLYGERISGAVVIEDPLKDRREAESASTRAWHKDWYHTLETRLDRGASVIVIASRWHTDDLSGYLVREHAFQYVNLKAIADDDRPVGDHRRPGEALWEEKRPLSMLLERKRENERLFAALYQGMPEAA